MGAIVMLIAGMILMGANISELRQLGQAGQRSNQALRYLADVDSNILSTELSLRGYALSGQQVFVQFYQEQATGLRAAIGQLNATLADCPQEAARLGQLNTFVSRRLVDFPALISLKAAHSEVVTHASIDLSLRAERIRVERIIGVIRDDEIKLSYDRQAAAERKIRQTYVLSSVIVILAFGLVVLGLVLMGAVHFRGGGAKHP
ncbi:MAG: CHASE3 domain-containing protein [Rhizomicrobium sp.]